MAVTHVCVHSCNSLMLLAEQYTSVSSAYKLQAPKSTCILISLTYIKNKIGPKQTPEGHRYSVDVSQIVYYDKTRAAVYSISRTGTIQRYH